MILLRDNTGEPYKFRREAGIFGMGDEKAVVILQGQTEQLNTTNHRALVLPLEEMDILVRWYLGLPLDKKPSPIVA